MEFLRQTLQQVQEHLKGLSLSQKMVIVLCAGMIVLSLAWLMHWSVTPDMVALLDQSFNPTELSSAQRELNKLGVSYSIQGDRVLVPSDKRDLVLARLQESEALPSDTTIGFAKLLEQQSIWISNDERVWQRDLALDAELARVLRSFSGVRAARVFIERPNRRGFGENRSEPKASVQLTMRDGTGLGQGFVQAVATFVAGAVVGLKPTNVSIVDSTGKSYRIRSQDGAMAADMLDDVREKEEHYAEKIRNQLAYIPGVVVNVHAETETEAKRVEDRTVKPMAVEEEATSNSERMASSSGEPGVVPNTAASVPGGAGGGGREETVERNKYAPGDQRTTITQNMPGAIKRLTAAVTVPRSYVTQILKQRSGAETEPTDDEVAKFSGEQLAQIKAQVKPLINATSDDQVEVVCVYDVLSPQGEMVLASASGTMQSLLAEYGRPVSLAGLAAMSLTLMLVLVRKAQPPPPLRLDTGRSGGSGGGVSGGGMGSAGIQIDPDGTVHRLPEEMLAIEGGPVGKAQPTQPILEGKEVDERTLKSQQIVSQVNNLVKDDPDSVASMLRKWIEEPH